MCSVIRMLSTTVSGHVSQASLSVYNLKLYVGHKYPLTTCSEVIGAPSAGIINISIVHAPKQNVPLIYLHCNDHVPSFEFHKK